MITVIGIDPGKGGGLAALHGDGNISVSAMLIAGKELDIVRIADWIERHADTNTMPCAIVCIEKVHAMVGRNVDGTTRKQGTVSMFTFGKNVGILYGIVSTLGLPLYEVAPQTWKKAVLAGTLKDKQAAIDYCRRVYPSVSLLATTRSKKAHDGMADALCIARYAYDKYSHTILV